MGIGLHFFHHFFTVLPFILTFPSLGLCYHITSLEDVTVELILVGKPSLICRQTVFVMPGRADEVVIHPEE